MLKKFLPIIICSITCYYGCSQVDSTVVDSKYLEDQFYLGLNYNRLINVPTDDFIQNGVSGGLYVGYIRDIPFNKNRNIGVGIGLGYSFNVYLQNIKIIETSNRTSYEIIPTDKFDKNRFSTKTIELPIELRWRNSTATKYSFWRIYGGLKLGYVLSSKSIYEDSNGRIEVKDIQELEKLQYGLTFSVGYSSINLNFYYGLNPLFEGSKTVDDVSIDLTRLSVGLIFYIL
jgi:hypothetical protein